MPLQEDPAVDLVLCRVEDLEVYPDQYRLEDLDVGLDQCRAKTERQKVHCKLKG